MTQEQPSRRRFPRIPANNAVLVHQLGEGEREELSRTQCLGLGGCMFISPESFGVGAFLRLLITINREVVETVARVVYEIPEEGSRYKIGVEFLVINSKDEERIASLFAESEDTTADGCE